MESGAARPLRNGRFSGTAMKKADGGTVDVRIVAKTGKRMNGNRSRLHVCITAQEN